tara:strand:+ start:554 stop:1012 length:459 start_codon:yes stop_codon:yes gene_type:complete
MINSNRDTAVAKKIEEDVAWFIGYNLGRTVINMPDEYSPFDFILSKQVNGLHVATAIAEFRHRPTTLISDFNTFTINKIKIDKLRDWGREMKIPPLLMVLWKDTGVMWCKVRKDYKVIEQTRKVQERENDRAEQLYEIPVVNFKLLMEYTVR